MIEKIIQLFISSRFAESNLRNEKAEGKLDRFAKFWSTIARAYGGMTSFKINHRNLEKKVRVVMQFLRDIPKPRTEQNWWKSPQLWKPLEIFEILRVKSKRLRNVRHHHRNYANAIKALRLYWVSPCVLLWSPNERCCCCLLPKNLIKAILHARYLAALSRELVSEEPACLPRLRGSPSEGYLLHRVQLVQRLSFFRLCLLSDAFFLATNNVVIAGVLEILRGWRIFAFIMVDKYWLRIFQSRSGLVW